MASFQQFLVLLLVLAFASSSIASNEVYTSSLTITDDVLGLIAFKSELTDPFNYLTSWSEDDDSPCSWRFVECNPATGRVSVISLDSLGLSGRLGKGLQKVQRLKVLSLSNNNFSGSISAELGLIPSLERLNLSRNSFSGLVPSSLLGMSSVKFLDVSENQLSGPIPDDAFGNCLSFRYLSLAVNSLEGPLPSSLGRCTSLNTLNVSKNYFSGSPSFSAPGIWSLSRIRTLDLSHNAFSGTVPRGIAAIHNLKELRLQSNRFFGPVPGDVGLCPHLIKLDLSQNQFDGEIPYSLSRLTSSLAYLSLSKNMLTGEFPQWIGNISNLEYLDLSNNGLTGSLPFSLGDLKSLKYFSLSNNRVTGSIPSSVGYCNSLSVIRLRSNFLNGSIPEGLLSLGLEEVDLANNGLSGTIPPGSKSFFASVSSVDISKNNLVGDIMVPGEKGLSSNLKYLNLSWNNLQSEIPPELGYFPNLTVTDLRNSGLIGAIPADICLSASLNILQLDGNALVGPIPEEIGNCSSLYLLGLSHNNLRGTIPKSISKLSKLKILELEVNNLSGEIPKELGGLKNLLAANVSYNRLIGRIPDEGIFPSLDASSLQGNLGLCSRLLSGPCKLNVPKPLVLDPYAYPNQMGNHRPEDDASSNSMRFHHHMFLSVSAIVAISAAVFIVIGVVAITLLNASVRKRLAFVDQAMESMCSTSSRSGSLATGKLILFDSKSSSDWTTNPESLLNKADEIGEGIFGTVYKVSLGAQGRQVAIKRLVTSTITPSPEDFDREVRLLGKARHANLVPLKGYYWSPQLQLLVSDYAPSGSLQTKLHEILRSSSPLSWATRFKIILGTAKGLAHLHHFVRPPIIHYNIKPSNILLDENFNPMISDFGLARLVTKLDKHVMSNRFQSAVGYVAPELACQSLRVTEKCDIYGFGILILELVTGRRPVEYGEDNVVILNDHVRVLLEQGNALDCVDLRIGDYPEDEVMPVLKLALVCTSQIPSSRPSMAEVVQILQVIKTPVPERIEMF